VQVVRWIFLFILINQVASCGQKGPLELPKTAAIGTVCVAAI
jgi:predicted small lipoprotein YifL